mmetsp:Transcript_5804/g.12646  ORF Transcript_5804/g.12646 Transcript_5804/m.12646 type:complete len:152 (+) Transcript_5804:118-573(+)
MSGTYSCNDNQNYFVEEGRTTSRVLAPPGGKTSICLGWEEPKKKPETKKKKTVDQTKTAGEKENDGSGAPTVVATSVEAKKVEDKTSVDDATDSSAATQPPAPAVAAGTSSTLSANAFASGSNQNSGNVMTGRPTSRVLAPPGGHCSIQLF